MLPAPSGELAGQVALVTGASRGIGRAIALRLADHGATVIVHYAAAVDEARNLVTEIRANGGEAFEVSARLENLAEIGAMFEAMRARVARLDILVNNAGHGSGINGTLDKVTPEDFDQLFAVNARAPFFVTQHALSLMPDGGRVVNISSESIRTTMSGMSAYGGSKSAVETFTRLWANELAPRKITVNCVSPGITNTDFLRANMSEAQITQSAAGVPLGRIGEPADIAEAVVFFCRPTTASWITGQTLRVCGKA